MHKVLFCCYRSSNSIFNRRYIVEQKARTTYEALINQTNDEDIIGPLLFLRQREVVHFNCFKELYDYYKKMGIN